MNHLTAGELLEIINGSERPPEHFLNCDVCLSRALSVKELQASPGRAAAMGGALFLSRGVGDNRVAVDCVAGDEIADYLEGTSTRPKFIKDHIQKCDRCFELASYYFTESSGMRAAGDAVTPARYKEAALNLVSRKAVKSRRQIRLPRWIIAPLPAYAAAVLIWFAVTYAVPDPQVTLMATPSHYTVYQKKADSMPLYYFGVTGKKVSVRPAKMRVTADRREVRFSWEPVIGVKTYYFVLQEIRGNVPRVVRNFKIDAGSFSLRRELFLPSARYRWIVAGGLPPDKYFDGRLEFWVR